jgi:hypothetical protein
VRKAGNYTAATWDFGIFFSLSFNLIKISITSTQTVSQVSGLEKFKSLFLVSDNSFYKKSENNWNQISSFLSS